jgi:peptidoglycan/xylan/chitin deacetylase (PgdA/CDA1 family)
MTVALTFDAGSDVGYTSMVLNTLAANGVKASFGITGLWAERNPDLARRIVNEGHSLINHSYDHKSFTGRATRTAALSQHDRWGQLNRTEEVIASLTGGTTLPYFRPPYGDHDEWVNYDVAAKGYMFNVLWTVDSRGWLGWSAPAIANWCIQQAVPGAIYVFHVGSRSQDGPALQSIIDGLRAKGYAIGGVADVLAP